MKGKGLIVVGLVMTAVILGAFGVQYYTWTAPMKVTKLTKTVTLDSNSESGAMHNGTENWGCDANIENEATAAENIYIPADERIDLGFQVIGTDEMVNKFDDLDVHVNLYISGENLDVQPYNENCLLENIVSDGKAYVVSGTLENGTSDNGFEPGITLAAVIHIFENTKAVRADDNVKLPIDIWAKEHP